MTDPEITDTGAKAPGNSWGVPEAIVGFGIGVLCSAVTAGIAESATGYHPSSHSSIPLAVEIADLCGLWIGLLGAAIVASRIRGTRSLRRDYGFGLGKWWDVPVGATIGLVCQFGLIPLLYLPFELVDRHLSHQLRQPVTTETSSAHSAGTAIAVILFLAVGAPVVEELFFRGLLLRGLLGRTPLPLAVALDGILFGLAHFEAVQFAGLAVFGVVLSLLAWRTARLTPGIGAHAAFNLVAVLSVIHIR